MKIRFLFIFLFHMISVTLVLFPKQFKGPVITVINNTIPITIMDTVAVILVLAGSVVLFLTLFKFLKSQPKFVENTQKIADQPAEKAR